VYTGEHARQIEEAYAWLYCCSCRQYPPIFFNDSVDVYDGWVVARLYLDSAPDRLRVVLVVTPAVDENEITITDGADSITFTVPGLNTTNHHMLTLPIAAGAGVTEYTLSVALAATYCDLHSIRFSAYRLRSI
jgi:hypothetical protein